MKRLKILSMSLIALLMISLNSSAADYDWMKDFNIRAEADPSGFRARLEARFQLGDVKIKAVLGNVDKPADAYVLLRLVEISNKPIEYVIEKYKAENGKGWGALAKNLGIKPGSNDFHALKLGQDIYMDKKRDKAKSKGKGKGRK